jgi:hypothetical protein
MDFKSKEKKEGNSPQEEKEGLVCLRHQVGDIKEVMGCE